MNSTAKPSFLCLEIQELLMVRNEGVVPRIERESGVECSVWVIGNGICS